mmetsp:Transcript_5035/g.16331  ORF Transcript_5035/g.16331 Transcript_5035/m.16331 type:complete len:212 (+) Transcript_5035:19-654(+)
MRIGRSAIHGLTDPATYANSRSSAGLNCCKLLCSAGLTPWNAVCRICSVSPCDTMTTTLPSSSSSVSSRATRPAVRCRTESALSAPRGSEDGSMQSWLQASSYRVLGPPSSSPNRRSRASLARIRREAFPRTPSVSPKTPAVSRVRRKSEAARTTGGPAPSASTVRKKASAEEATASRPAGVRPYRWVPTSGSEMMMPATLASDSPWRSAK